MPFIKELPTATPTPGGDVQNTINGLPRNGGCTNYEINKIFFVDVEFKSEMQLE